MCSQPNLTKSARIQHQKKSPAHIVQRGFFERTNYRRASNVAPFIEWRSLAVLALDDFAQQAVWVAQLAFTSSLQVALAFSDFSPACAVETKAKAANITRAVNLFISLVDSDTEFVR